MSMVESTRCELRNYITYTDPFKDYKLLEPMLTDEAERLKSQRELYELYEKMVGEAYSALTARCGTGRVNNSER